MLINMVYNKTDFIHVPAAITLFALLFPFFKRNEVAHVINSECINNAF